jgi:hypothetical protein
MEIKTATLMTNSNEDGRVPYAEGQLVRVSHNGKWITTKVHVSTAKPLGYKKQKICPICGKPGRESKDFTKANKQGYYRVSFIHRIASVRFTDVDAGTKVKRLQYRKYCKVGKGYTMGMLLQAMSKDVGGMNQVKNSMPQKAG